MGSITNLVRHEMNATKACVKFQASVLSLMIQSKFNFESLKLKTSKLNMDQVLDILVKFEEQLKQIIYQSRNVSTRFYCIRSRRLLKINITLLNNKSNI